MADLVFASLFLVFGALVLAIATLFPRTLHDGYRHWFLGRGPRLSRGGAGAIGAAALLLGVLVGGWVPAGLTGLTLFVALLLAVAAFVHDLLATGKAAAPATPAHAPNVDARAESRAGRRRRRHRR